jgi:hypothetical protein
MRSQKGGPEHSRRAAFFLPLTFLPSFQPSHQDESILTQTSSPLGGEDRGEGKFFALTSDVKYIILIKKRGRANGYKE